MVHLRPVILALLFALAAPVTASAGVLSPPSAVSAPTADMQVYAPEGTASVMTLGEGGEETRAFARPSVDLGTTLATETYRVERRVATTSLATRFAQAETRDEKRDLLFQYATDIDTRSLQLERRERLARRGLQNGSVSAQAYLHTVAEIDAEATSLQADIDQIELYTNDVEQFSMTSFLRNLDKRLLSLQSPVRDRLSRVVSGADPAVTFYVAVADTGVVLSMIDDGSYAREVFRADLRSDGDAQISRQEATEIINQTYPWTLENAFRSTWNGITSSGYQKYTMEHPHGQVVSYIDTNNEVVFIERQRVFLTKASAVRNQATETLPRGTGDVANESGLTLSVNRSYPGGPMYVSLTDENGTAVEGTILVDDDVRGQTTDEGGLWTLSPAGSFNVTARSGLDEVTVATRSMRPITRTTNSSQA